MGNFLTVKWQFSGGSGCNPCVPLRLGQTEPVDLHPLNPAAAVRLVLSTDDHGVSGVHTLHKRVVSHWSVGEHVHVVDGQEHLRRLGVRLAGDKRKIEIYMS